ncbi:nitrate- and nitrite sensing domain-containing protein [Nocardia sp. NPDC058499]|uniref:sensor histidine kinase n=1 Tax=Nocardia sp. NPDC058499 TaxID=3346530 RepID=UPI003646810D
MSGSTLGFRLPLAGTFLRKARSGANRTRGRVGIRTRLLAIVLVTSIALVTIGIGAAAYLVRSGRDATTWAELASSTTSPAILMVRAFSEERRLSLLLLAGDTRVAPALVAARGQSDIALAEIFAKGDAAQQLNPEGAQAEIAGYQQLFGQVPTTRAAVDAGTIPRPEAFAFYSSVIETIVAASMLAARVAPDAGVAISLGYGVEPLRAADALSKADTLGAAALTLNELTEAQLVEFNRYAGEFRGEVAYSAAVLKGERLAQLRAITDSAPYRQVIAMQDALMAGGARSAAESEDSSGTYESDATESDATGEPAALPMDIATWQQASGQVIEGLLKLWEDQSNDAHVTARAQGDDTAAKSMLGGSAVLLLTGLTFLGALLMANRFIARMRHLRNDTLDLADNRLPDLMRRLDDGAEVDTTAEVAQLDFGTDELGEVADAFNRAQLAAVSAAVAEAKTRAGFNAVFLNMAHRNQLAVHRQLALLDQAERREENADQLELLFQLDHLATRARRHAENLIVLGGEQPGRRWRKPVSLWDIIRAAAAESLDYTRIHTGRVPEMRVVGKTAADLIHLLAELMDNATAFSPPDSRVEVSATLVGRGVAIEVADQGLGMPEDEIAERNLALAQPPDFGVTALTGDTRLGLFVVATLAARQGISVRLTESAYGGIKAIVLIPTALTEPAGPPPLEAAPVIEPALAGAAPAAPLPFRTSPSTTFATAPVYEEPYDSRTLGSDVYPAVTSEVRYPEPHAEPAPYRAGAGRPPLPRRHRKATDPTVREEDPDAGVARPRTPEQARNRMSAISRGSRSGRRAPYSDTDAPERSRREGER